MWWSANYYSTEARGWFLFCLDSGYISHRVTPPKREKATNTRSLSTAYLTILSREQGGPGLNTIPNAISPGNKVTCRLGAFLISSLYLNGWLWFVSIFLRSSLTPGLDQKSRWWSPLKKGHGLDSGWADAFSVSNQVSASKKVCLRMGHYW